MKLAQTRCNAIDSLFTTDFIPVLCPLFDVKGIQNKIWRTINMYAPVKARVYFWFAKLQSRTSLCRISKSTVLYNQITVQQHWTRNFFKNFWKRANSHFEIITCPPSKIFLRTYQFASNLAIKSGQFRKSRSFVPQQHLTFLENGKEKS